MSSQRPIGFTPPQPMPSHPTPTFYGPPPSGIIMPPSPSIYPTIPQPTAPINSFNPNPAGMSYPYPNQPQSYPAPYPNPPMKTEYNGIPSYQPYPKQEGYPYPGQPNNISSAPTGHKPQGNGFGSVIASLPGAALLMKGTKLKKQKLKKAMKYGLPIAGAGVGAYALSKVFRRGSSSSSSSSSDSD